MTVEEKYPFRFEGPKVGDKVWFACEERITGSEGPIEVTITEVYDMYDMYQQPESGRREDFLIDYFIDAYPYHGLAFGLELYLTKEDALKYYYEEG